MRCSECDADNATGQKFCGSCGKALKLRCPSCDAANPPGFRFCGQCGVSLAAPETAASARKSVEPQIRVAEAAAENLEGERKTVTALFADIKGSTELEQDLDPEEARAIVDPALRLMIDAVQRYDGYIVQSTGDGIFALFGAPVAHEDHPQRALYAALRMQEDLRRYSAKLVADGGNPLQCRVGVNTGEVVVRSISTGGGHAEYTPIGHTTNLASRMQAVAPVGSIAVPEPARSLVDGYFALKPLGPTRIKGVSEPVNVYEVTGLGPLRTRLQRSAGRGLTKFVGREREMEAMRNAAELSKGGHGQIVAAIAEAGTGKSRLFFEFKARNQSGWMVLEAFSVSHGKASAYLPVLDLLHTYFKITLEDDARTRREKVTGRVLALDRSLEDALPYLFGLLGIVEGEDPLARMDGEVKKRRTLEAIKRMLLRESLNQPLMVIFEDLHWIDEQTQEFLNLLADSLANARFLLLVNYRPEYAHQWGSKTYYTRLRLDPLGRESADEMLATLLGNSANLAPLKQLVVEKTEGNPFFMEETVQVLLDEGALVRNGIVKLTKPIRDLKIPPTVQGILASRIDRLPAHDKDLLQTLSVIGREFPMSLIRAVVSKPDEELDRMLNDLQLEEFIYEQPAVSDTEYVFKHALTQEVSYNSVLMERRKALHERIGAALENLYANSTDDHLDELAHHYARSGNADKASRYLQRAAVQAFGRSAYQEALDQLDAAIDFLGRIPESPQRDEREADLQSERASIIMVLRGIGGEGLDRAHTRRLELAERTGNTLLVSDAMGGLLLLHFARGEYAIALKLGRRRLDMAEAMGDPDSISWAQHELGQTLGYIGNFTAARSMLEQAVAAPNPDPTRLRSIDRRVISRIRLSQMLTLLGYPSQGLKMALDAVSMARELSRQFDLFTAMNGLAAVHLLVGDLSAALVVRRNAAEMVERIGETIRPHAMIDHGYLVAMQGQTDGLTEMEQQMGQLGKTIRAGWPWFIGRYAQALQMNGREAEAGSAIDEALALAEAMGEGIYLAELRRLAGELALARNASAASEAERCFRTAIEIAQKQSAKWWELRATTSLARLLRDTNRRHDSRAMLFDIYNWFTEGFDTADLKDARALLDELGG